MDLDHRFRPNSGLGGRIILLGDGTEIPSELADSDMFDHDDEDKDLESQVNKFAPKESVPNAKHDSDATTSNQRQEMPAPKSTSTQSSNSQVSGNQETSTSDSPSSVKTEKSETVAEPKLMVTNDSRLPEKIVEGVSDK